jgi:hypothetical protein
MIRGQTIAAIGLYLQSGSELALQGIEQTDTVAPKVILLANSSDAQLAA